MKLKWLNAFFCLLLVSGGVSAQMENPAMRDLQVDIVYLASDLLEGRETGTKGELLAAEYIAGRLEEAGLKPAGTNGSWFHEFELTYKSNPHSEEGEKRTGRNVLGYIDNGADKVIVIGAHYDHLGHGIFGSRHTGEPAIHNGADDNASGVAGLLFLAQALKNSAATSNNYLFIAFSGEEMGLHGSKRFVESPTIQLEDINYMLNMDMIGRLNEEGTLIVNGVGTSPVWKELLESVEVKGINQLNTTESGIGPSDHTSFYLEDIPVLHFWTGQHEDYHKPEDDSHLVNFEGLYAITMFIQEVIERLDDEGQLAFTKTKDEQQGRQAARFKVSLGVMPDYVFEGKGMRIDGVLDGRAAQAAGMERGDVIIQMGELEVKDIYDYMEGLGQYEKGDKAKVKVKRDEEVLELEVQF